MNQETAERYADRIRATLPRDLQAVGRFCLWKRETRPGQEKPAKIPYNARTGAKARADVPGDFVPLAAALDALQLFPGDYDGAGLAVTGADLVGVDIDACINDRGELSELARDIVQRLDSYTEKSPSGHGIRIFCRCPGLVYDRDRYYIKNSARGLEIYAAGITRRFLTITGDAIRHAGADALPIRAAELAGIIADYMRRPEPEPMQRPAPDPSTLPTFSDAEIIARASEAANGATFRALWAGDFAGLAPSHSEADLALCNLLAFWTGPDPARIDALFRQSGLMRDKWDTRRGKASTYGADTIRKALAGLVSWYGSDRPSPADAFRDDPSAGALAWDDSIGDPGDRDPDALPIRSGTPDRIRDAVAQAIGANIGGRCPLFVVPSEDAAEALDVAGRGLSLWIRDKAEAGATAAELARLDAEDRPPVILAGGPAFLKAAGACLASRGLDFARADTSRDFEQATAEAYRQATARAPYNVADYIRHDMARELATFRGDLFTGFSILDEKTGGLYPGLYVLAAPSSLGKTSLCLQMADQIAAQGRDVLFFSLEQSRAELVSKSLARTLAAVDPFSNITALSIRKGHNAEAAERASGRYLDSVADRVSIIEGAFLYGLDELAQTVRDHIKRTGARPVVFVDYLQILRPPVPKDPKQRYTDRKSETDATITALKLLSRELAITVFCVSSVNRAAYQAALDFESLKESGGIEYTADAVLALELQALKMPIFESDARLNVRRAILKRERAAMPCRYLSLSFLKNRYGAAGIETFFEYYPAQDRFIERPVINSKYSQDDPAGILDAAGALDFESEISQDDPPEPRARATGSRTGSKGGRKTGRPPKMI